MWEKFRYVLVILALLALAVPVVAQEPPTVVNVALEDLSTRIGQPVTLNDLQAWEWEGNIYQDTSLGCPQPGEVYAEVLTSGFQFLLDFQGTIYDYRVSTDGQIVVLCEPADQLGVGGPTTPVDPVVGDACAGLLTQRIQTDQAATVEAGINALRLRDAPNLQAEIIARMPGGSELQVLEGPTCDPAASVVWWQVQYADLTGWAAESQRTFYYIRPGTDVPDQPGQPDADFVCPTLLPTRLEADGEARVTLAAQLRVNFRTEPGLASSIIGRIPTGTTLTLIAGPTCGPDNILWWQTEYQNTTGWVAENDGGFYILEPVITEQATTDVDQ